MPDTYLSHYRHLIFPIHRYAHTTWQTNAQNGAEPTLEMDKKLAEHQIDARFSAQPNRAGMLTPALFRLGACCEEFARPRRFAHREACRDMPS